MRTPYSRLEDRVCWFGNHHRKYLHFIQTKQALLIERLEEKGLIEQVHLWSAAGNRFAKEMRLIQSIGESKKEKLDFMGWFYSSQFLLMNIRAIDVLSLNLKLGQNRLSEYKHFMKQIGLEFRKLTAVYMQNLLDLFIPVENRPDFVVLSVGTRADQDDIDLAVIDDGSHKKKYLNQAIGQLQKEMLKHASRLHLYLSESIGTNFFSISIAEFHEFFQKETHDFVLISEMLGAGLVFGNEGLFLNFQQSITNRYYYNPDADNRFHEAYLRGILGEIRSLLARKIHSDSVNPKDDALRIIKALAYAGKSICGIEQVNAWEILEVLSLQQPHRAAEYQTLEGVLSFFELFRFLYQLFIVQEEEIFIEEEQDIAHLEMIAEIMGYQKTATKRANDFLLVHYYENIELTRRISTTLLNDFTSHLKSTTVFLNLFQSTDENETDEVPLINHFFQIGRFFKNTKFWDDIFQLLADNKGELLMQLINSLLKLKVGKQKAYCLRMVKAAKTSYSSLFLLLVLFASKKQKPGCQALFDMLNDAFLRVVAEERDRAWRIARFYNYDAALLNKYIMAISEEKQKEFIALLEKGEIYTKEDILVVDKLKNLGKLYFNTSRYFRRYFITVINKYPQFIEYVDDAEQLRKFAKGFLGSVENYQSFRDKKENLRDSFYIDFFRIGLETLAGQSLEFIEREFTEFFLNYLRELYNICRQEVEAELNQQVMTKDLLAIFVAGSLGREQAFDDDLDIIVLLNSEDQEIRAYCSKIMTRMNREIVRLAFLPHYRFAEINGNYVTLISELEEILSQDNSACFIEKAQLLGARMIVGSSRFEKTFMKRIINPFIYDDNKAFIQAMQDEMHSRHNMVHKLPDATFNIKEAIGGLRDIELILLICKSCYKLDDPVNRKLLDTLGAISEECAESMKLLGESFDFLRQLRNLYRILVAARNSIAIEYLERPAHIMGFRTTEEKTAAKQLFEKFEIMCKNSAYVLNEIMEKYALESAEKQE